ncbi:hypothetical protein MBAV_005977 [Candidatus Magnetobacterium bavaricum]|uniref:Uncharacterized protein n=1 Tax=Candidatus Magnetobacterium bavaricum TaxID=29290 RepID=A0A0F3GIX1_9BACT|nr:hypothetical protein MBAV_005977 [Candidatus Magnetobacterium bavaricum]
MSSPLASALLNADVVKPDSFKDKPESLELTVSSLLLVLLRLFLSVAMAELRLAALLVLLLLLVLLDC